MTITITPTIPWANRLTEESKVKGLPSAVDYVYDEANCLTSVSTGSTTAMDGVAFTRLVEFPAPLLQRLQQTSRVESLSMNTWTTPLTYLRIHQPAERPAFGFNEQITDNLTQAAGLTLQDSNAAQIQFFTRL